MKPFAVTFIAVFSILTLFGQHKNAKVDSLTEKAWRFMSVDQDSVLYYCYQADSIALENDYAIGLGFSNIYKGWVAFYKSDFPQALQRYKEAEKTAKREDHPKLLGRTLVSIGAYYTQMGDLANGMTYYQSSLEALKEAGDKEWENYAYNNIGVNYQFQNRHLQAAEYFQKALLLFKERNDPIGIVLSYNNLSNSYESGGQIDSAIYYSEKALEGARQINYQRIIGASLANLSSYHSNKGNFGLAEEYLSQAKTFYKELDDPNELVEVALIEASIEMKKNRPEKAIEILKQIHPLVDSIGVIGHHVSLNQKMAQLYSDRKDYKKSNEYLMEYIFWNDSLINVNNLEQINELEVRYQTNEKILEIDNLNQEKQLIELEVEQKRKDEAHQRRIRNWGFAIAGLILLLLSIIVGIIYNKNKKINRVNQIIRSQKAEVEQQKHIIEATHKEITDSISYAKGLQDAILPKASAITSALPHNFVFFQPKDVVSGDFYWFEQLNGFTFIAVADCTGHGVPGALVSVVCSNALNRSVHEYNLTDPAAILNQSRALIIETFAKSGENVKDGMDISICVIDAHQNLTYAGANNPLWIVRQTSHLDNDQKANKSNVITNDNSLIEFKGDKQPVGLYEQMHDFSQTTVRLFPEDQFYLFTDGFADQFGDEKGKKFKYRPFKKFLISIAEHSMEKQAVLLTEQFETWKGNYEQVDDVCVMGFKL